MNTLNRNEIFNFEGRNITFKVGDVIMVNATEMAKGFGKRPANWLSNEQAKDIIACVSAVTGIPVTGLVSVNQGGTNQGTWMHEDVALVFAQWLSPKFYIWCNDKIKELLTTGKTQLKQEETDDLIFEKAVLIAQKRIEEQKIRIAALEVENKELRPDAEYTKEVLKSENTYTMTQIAKEFGYSCQAFAEKLIKCDIIYKQSGQYMLTAKYCNMGYTKNRTHPFVTNSGTQVNYPQAKDLWALDVEKSSCIGHDNNSHLSWVFTYPHVAILRAALTSASATLPQCAQPKCLPCLMPM